MALVSVTRYVRRSELSTKYKIPVLFLKIATDPMNRVMRPPHSTDVSFIQKPKKLATRGQADAIPALPIRFSTCRVICIISSPTSLKHRTTRAPSCGIRSFPNSENPATSCSKLKFRRVAKLIHFNFFLKKGN